MNTTSTINAPVGIKEKSMSIQNTTTDTPIENFAIAVFGGIEMQEAQGQRQLAKSTQLPTKGIKSVEAIGVKIIRESSGDPLFTDVELPEGWSIKPTDNSMWSDLVDANGRIRASIFYKAAFYDRDAFMNISRRYSATYGLVGGWNSPRPADPKDIKYYGVAKDGDTELWRSNVFSAKSEGIESWDCSSRACNLSGAWLNEHFPDWENPAAYFD